MMINFTRNDGTMEHMTIEEFTRWMCLVEALYVIEEKAKEMKVNPKSLKKSIAIGAYIAERYPAMLHDVKQEIELGNI